jgi:hypothetical protein
MQAPRKAVKIRERVSQVCGSEVLHTGSVVPVEREKVRGPILASPTMAAQLNEMFSSPVLAPSRYLWDGAAKDTSPEVAALR